ncbi:MAG: imidazole glycerol phosphate synthase subunit HisH [Candidatus Omnitrophica bacterium]|nr:imidazole glycerol phosphate synthase subunit HisH [Candidatus Omnitrophota bacterium]
MTGIIDYGSGNLKSVYNAFKYIGENAKVCIKGEELFSCDRIVLPGVGSSMDAMSCLKKNGFIEPLLENIKNNKPFLGICLGLQLLYEFSQENGGTECLGLIKGSVKLFPNPEKKLKVPQIGWNTVDIVKEDCPIFAGIETGSYFYFVHSYYCDSENKDVIAGTTDFGVKYTSALWKDNIYALQFHPERSQDKGLKILENFIKL